MTRFAWLLPVSLGVFLACGDWNPTSPDYTAGLAADALTEDAAAVVIDVQPLGDLDDSAINLASGQPFVTVAVVDFPGFFELVDLSTVTFSGAPLLHEELIEQNPGCHITTVYAGDVPLYEAHLLHFELTGLTAGVVSMCLSGSFADDPQVAGDLAGTTFDTCVDVTVQSKGGSGAR